MREPLYNNEFVSVVMGTYNGKEFLSEQLNSILSQTWTNLEIIICYEHSKDGTQDSIRSFDEKDVRIKYYLLEKNICINKNFEFGFQEARGNYIAIADQDDVWKENKIETVMSLFTTQAILVAHSASVVFKK